MTTTLRCTSVLTALLFLFLAGGMPAPAQPAQAAPALADTFAIVVPLRPLDEIAKDKERADLLRTLAKQRLSRAEEEISALKSVISAREKDLEALKGYVNTLDSDSAEKEITLQKEKISMLEKVLELVELRKEVREGEISSAKAAMTFAESQEDFYSLEGDLAKKRDERVSLANGKGAPAELAALDQSIKVIQEDVMDRWKKMLGRQDDNLSEEQDYLKLLGKLFEMQEGFRSR